VNCNWM